MNRRIFVEKKGLFDVESPKVLDELKMILPGIQSVKVYNIYDVFQLSDEDFNKVLHSTFVDPVTDELHLENPAKELFLATEFLPGQYDQRADSAEQCIALLTDNEKAEVRSGKLYVFSGIVDSDLPIIESHLVNKVESQEKDLSVLEIPKQELPRPIKYHKDLLLGIKNS